MSIFGEKFERYLDSGLSVIPLIGKRPAIKSWLEYQNRLPTKEECELWEEVLEKKITGIGLILGEVSGVIGLDIDDPAVVPLMPKSLVEREGRPGRVMRFFKYTGESTEKYLGDSVAVRSNKHYAVVEGLHPDLNMPYKWTVGALPTEDLPVLNVKVLKQICSELIKPENVSRETIYAPLDGGSGRNNKLTEISYAMACSGMAREDIASGLLESEHASWFSDPKEHHGGKSSKKEALHMADRAIKASIKKSERPLSNLAEVGLRGFDLEEEKEAKIEAFFEEVAIRNPLPPMPDGKLGETIALLDSYGVSSTPALAYGAALAIWATVASNRIQFLNIWPNLFILNLARSGTGKTNVNKNVLKLLSNTPLIGHANYKSGSGIYEGLQTQRERLDPLEEFGRMLNTMKKGGVFQQEMMDVICDLYSMSSGLYKLPTTAASSKDAKMQTLWNPSVSILASTTNKGAIDASSRLMIDKGLFPRFLLINSQRGSYRGLQDHESIKLELFNPMKSFIERVITAIPVFPSSVGMNNLTQTDYERLPRQLLCENFEVADWILEYSRKSFKAQEDLDKLGMNEDDEHIMISFEARRFENVMKIAMSYAFSEWVGKVELKHYSMPDSEIRFCNLKIAEKRGPLMVAGESSDPKWVISMKHLLWAEQMFQYSYINYENFVNKVEEQEIQTHNDKRSQRFAKKINELFGTKGYFYNSEMQKTMSGSTRVEIKNELDAMIDTGLVIKWPSSNGGKGMPRILYIKADKFEEVGRRLKLIVESPKDGQIKKPGDIPQA